MPTKRWEADAPAIKQKDVRTVGATAAVGNTLVVTSALGAVYTYTFDADDTTNALAAASFVEDFNNNAGEISAEFNDVVASSSGADVTFTARTPGKPFSFSYSGGGTTPATFAAGSGGVSNSGPSVYNVTANWGGANPTGSDDLIFDQATAGPLYLVDQLSSLSGTLTIFQSFENDIGLGPVDDGGYVQHRARYLTGAFTVVNIGGGDGNGSGRMWLNLTATNVVLNVFNTGRGSDQGYEALQVKGGSTTFTTVTVAAGELGLAILGGDTAVVTLLKVGTQNTSPRVRGGLGCTVTNLSVVNGVVAIETSPSGTVTMLGGAVKFTRGGNITTLTIDGGTLSLGGNGTAMTVTNCSVGEGAVYDLSVGTGAVTHTNPIYVDKGGTIYDPLDRLANNTDIITRGCTWDEITVVTGINRTWRKVA